MSHWYTRRDGAVSGPYALEDLAFLVARNKLSADDELRQGLNGSWTKASHVGGLFDLDSSSSAGDDAPTDAPHRSRPILAPKKRKVRSADGSPGTRSAPRDAGLPAGTIGSRGVAAGAYAGRPPGTAAQLDDEQAASSRKRSMLLGWLLGATAIALLLGLLLWLVSPDDETQLGSGDGGAANLRGRGTGWDGVGEDHWGTLPADGEGNRLASGRSHEAVDLVPEEDAEDRRTGDDEVDESSQDRDEPESPIVEQDAGAMIPPEIMIQTGEFTIQRLEDTGADGGLATALGGGLSGGAAAIMFQGRSPEMRAELVELEGGTPESEAAVQLGLQWLAAHQDENGRWSLNEFPHVGECEERCGHTGIGSDTAATGLALLPFLGAGQTHELGTYQQTVGDGLRWLCDDQESSGSFRNVGGGNMYAHAQASIALCEALAMTGDPELREPAERAVDYIVNAQHRAGGWRYSPKSAGDTSVMGWQILALRSAQAAGLQVPRKVFELAGDYLDSAQTDESGGLYAYMPGRRGAHTPAMTAEGLLCRQYTGWRKEQAGFAVGSQYLLGHAPNRAQPNIYYWYYATQVMHHLGGDDWKTWNEAIRETLIEMQETEGHPAGSWTPAGGHANRGGRIYMTALAICTLEIYYRHAALYGD